MKQLFLICLSILKLASAQNTALPGKEETIRTGNHYPDFELQRNQKDQFTIQLKKGTYYEFYVMQKGIDVVVTFAGPDGKQVLEKDSPNGTNGPEDFQYTTTQKGKYTITIAALDDSSNARKGKYFLYVKTISKKELARREAIKLELAEENKKNVQTADVDHFWEAFDQLATARTHADSVNIFQRVYIDRATDGFKDFIKVRNFTAEEYTKVIGSKPKFYSSVRNNTYKVKEAAPLIDAVFNKFSSLYPGFKPFKVCFAIGTIRTAGTVSSSFVLIGSEMTTATRNSNFTEFQNKAMADMLAGDTNIVQKIRNIVSHECVHTQQKWSVAKDAQKCDLLYACLQEGICDFIGELVAGDHINKLGQEYGDKHEAELWKEFSAATCNGSINNWLYNYGEVKDRPADLGYYIGYRIAKAYYNAQTDKQSAIADIIEMDNPLQFLEKSGYAGK
jgi:hypothetical protein